MSLHKILGGFWDFSANIGNSSWHKILDLKFLLVLYVTLLEELLQTFEANICPSVCLSDYCLGWMAGGISIWWSVSLFGRCCLWWCYLFIWYLFFVGVRCVSCYGKHRRYGNCTYMHCKSMYVDTLVGSTFIHSICRLFTTLHFLLFSFNCWMRR